MFRTFFRPDCFGTSHFSISPAFLLPLIPEKKPHFPEKLTFRSKGVVFDALSFRERANHEH
jgi:hypothetical protein